MFWNLFNSRQYPSGEWTAIWCIENAIQSVIAVDLCVFQRRNVPDLKRKMIRDLEAINIISDISELGKDKTWMNSFVLDNLEHIHRFLGCMPDNSESSAATFGFNRTKLNECLYLSSDFHSWLIQHRYKKC